MEIDTLEQDKFWSLVEPTGFCWLWLGGQTKQGYGQLYVSGRMYGAHRISYTVLVGEIPEGLHLDHLCRVPLCVNPDHLEPVTQGENNARRYIQVITPAEREAKYLASGTPSNGRRGKPYKLPMSQRDTCKHGHKIAEVGTVVHNNSGKPVEICIGCREMYKARQKAKAKLTAAEKLDISAEKVARSKAESESRLETAREKVNLLEEYDRLTASLLDVTKQLQALPNI